ncbi:MAG: zf-HC2 domain-containing protein [Archangium sp.]|nr:zf-HC2 domain-containing protein [Archangium sp.]
MSLAEWKEDVEAAASGEMSTVEDLRVRQHLRTCDECRAHYDRMVNAARAMAGTTEPTKSEHDALFARLNATLDAQQAPKPQAAPSRRWWFFGAFAAVAAALLLVVVTRPPAVEDPEREITLRGGGNDVAPSLSFSVYAKAKSGGAVRLVAQFPQSGEARASEGDWLQVKAPNGVTVVAKGADGATVVFDANGSQALTKGTWKLSATTDGGLATGIVVITE